MSAHLPAGGGAVLLQHLAHGLAQLAQFVRLWRRSTCRAMIEDEAWPSAQAFTSWAKSVTTGAVHLEVDGDGRAAQLGMGGGAGVGLGQAAEPGDIARQFQDSAL